MTNYNLEVETDIFSLFVLLSYSLENFVIFFKTTQFSLKWLKKNFKNFAIDRKNPKQPERSNPRFARRLRGSSTSILEGGIKPDFSILGGGGKWSPQTWAPMFFNILYFWTNYQPNWLILKWLQFDGID